MHASFICFACLLVIYAWNVCTTSELLDGSQVKECPTQHALIRVHIMFLSTWRSSHAHHDAPVNVKIIACTPCSCDRENHRVNIFQYPKYMYLQGIHAYHRDFVCLPVLQLARFAMLLLCMHALPLACNMSLKHAPGKAYMHIRYAVSTAGGMTWRWTPI